MRLVSAMASCCCAWTGEARLQRDIGSQCQALNDSARQASICYRIAAIQIHTREGDRICALCQHASFYFCGLRRH